MGVREIQVAGHNHSLIIHELDDVYDSATGRPLTGSWLWDSALVLSHWISTHLNFQGKAVLELGAGAGLPGLTAALLGASRVLLTDVQQLLPGLLKNVEANGFKERVEVKELVWGSDESMSEIRMSSMFDVVLMSDLFFDPEEMTRLGRTLKRICGEGTEVWAASELRPWTSECLNQLMAQGFQVVELVTQLSVQEGVEDSNAFAIFQIIPPLADRYEFSTTTCDYVLEENLNLQ
ncbi:protein-lysine methyltransferase METTL21E-like [Durio zibethinus]|uniref:Protein-lysine methyltransferase METTL21E-like n=1 Tax=Durio zibethinus TaxID=66656 RepID=A0A6P5WQ76_DURZI|nr:protein-lysine methyltransferase METTL21E-like [Durio zibethinus]